jgi:hypothetical protein
VARCIVASVARPDAPLGEVSQHLLRLYPGHEDCIRWLEYARLYLRDAEQTILARLVDDARASDILRTANLLRKIGLPPSTLTRQTNQLVCV